MPNIPNAQRGLVAIFSIFFKVNFGGADNPPSFPGYRDCYNNKSGDAEFSGAQYSATDTQFYIHFPWLSEKPIPADTLEINDNIIIKNETALLSLFSEKRSAFLAATDSVSSSVIKNTTVQLDDGTYLSGIEHNFYPNTSIFNKVVEYSSSNSSNTSSNNNNHGNRNNDNDDESESFEVGSRSIEDMEWAFVPVRFHVVREPKPISSENVAATYDLNIANMWNYLSKTDINLVKTFNIPYTDKDLYIGADSTTFDKESYFKYHKSTGVNP